MVGHAFVSGGHGWLLLWGSPNNCAHQSSGRHTQCHETSSGICGTKGQAPDNPTLEKVYQTTRKGKLHYKQIQGLAKQLDWSERRIERWIRMRRMMDRPSTLVKFSESGWRLTYYAFAFSYGIWTLWDKPYLWDINHCWYNFPFQVRCCYSFHYLCYPWLSLFP